jgi:hypothetical protein
MEHAFIRMIFYMFVAIEMSLEEIAAALPRVKVPGVWDVDAVVAVLTNPEHRAIVGDDEAWELAQLGVDDVRFRGTAVLISPRRWATSFCRWWRWASGRLAIRAVGRSRSAVASRAMGRHGAPFDTRSALLRKRKTAS